MPAEYLSRAPCLSDQAETVNFTVTDVEYEYHVGTVLCELPITHQSVQRHTQNDFVLLKLLQYCKDGWPAYCKAPSEVRLSISSQKLFREVFMLV